MLSDPTNLTKADFAGLYHLRNIKSKYPIPGTQIAIEQARKEMEEASQRSAKEHARAEKERLRAEKARTHGEAANRGRQRQLTDALKAVYLTVGFNNKFQRALKTVDEREEASLAYQATQELRNVDGGARADCVRALHHAVRCNRIRDVKRILHHNLCDVNDTPDQLGYSALMVACAHRVVPMVKLLLRMGANAFQRSVNSEGPLHCVYRQLRLVPRKEQTLLESVRMHKAEVIADLLLEAGTDATSANRWGVTPLHLAAQFGHGRIVKLLLEFKVDREARTDAGDTPVDLARRYDHVDIARLINYWPTILRVSRDRKFFGRAAQQAHRARGKPPAPEEVVADIVYNWNKAERYLLDRHGMFHRDGRFKSDYDEALQRLEQSHRRQDEEIARIVAEAEAAAERAEAKKNRGSSQAQARAAVAKAVTAAAKAATAAAKPTAVVSVEEIERRRLEAERRADAKAAFDRLPKIAQRRRRHAYAFMAECPQRADGSIIDKDVTDAEIAAEMEAGVDPTDVIGGASFL